MSTEQDPHPITRLTVNLAPTAADALTGVAEAHGIILTEAIRLAVKLLHEQHTQRSGGDVLGVEQEAQVEALTRILHEPYPDSLTWEQNRDLARRLVAAGVRVDVTR